MGRSIGTAAALDLAARHCEKTLALILESAFDRTDDFLAGKGLPQGFSSEDDPFDNRSKMEQYTKPVLFLHSHADQVVNLNQIEWLVAESRSKATQLQIVPSSSREDLQEIGGELYHKIIRDFINLRLGRRPPRKKSRRLQGTASTES